VQWLRTFEPGRLCIFCKLKPASLDVAEAEAHPAEFL
jgi:hypothetical protein